MPTAGASRTSFVPGWLPGAVLLGLALLWAPRCGAQTAPALDFLYIDSTVDDAAGGHAAARLGETVFHYQFFSDGLFLLVNDPWEGFRHLYNDLQNRSVTLTRVPLSRDGYDRIRSHFFTRYVLQERRLLLLDQLTEEQGLLRRLAAGEDALEVEGLGFFSESQAGDPHALELKDIVVGRFGELWLSESLLAVTAQLGKTSFRGAAPGDRPVDAPAPPEPRPGWSVRLRELLALREALVLLGEARTLADDALLTADDNGGPLTDRERLAGEEYRRQLADTVLTLLASDRPDRGTALLLQMARYQALSRSLETGVLATLDPFSDLAERVHLDYGADSPLLEARAELAAYRGAFVLDAGLRGTAYNRIEAAQGRLSELEQSRRRRAPARVEEGHLLPRRGRAIRTGLQGTPEEFSRAARVATANRDFSRKELEQTYRYNLFTRNCVTEIVRDVNESFENREQELEDLGGALEPGTKLSFIPFRLTAAVRAAFPAAETALLPSYRLRQLDRLYQRSGPLVWLRENNTLTSTLYTPSWAEDSVFLFFTDDVVAPRPLLGTLNLLYATVHAAGGLLLAPVDRGGLLTRSLRGMLYSLPEIAFFNIRKGSFRDVPEAPEAPR
jgi:hypothetical protein